MSGSAFVVMPVENGDVQHRREETEKLTSALQQGLYEQQHPRAEEMTQERQRQEKMQERKRKEDEEQHGPLTELLAHQDSLYRYISWEDPLRTLGSYIAAMSVLLGMHYMPLTQLTLKYGAMTLGVISVAEFASRSFGPNTFIARLRPKQYPKVSEPILNSTLKDIHDFVQYSVVQIQRVLYAEDLDKTFYSFLLLTSMYFLAKIASPISWAIIGLTSVYLAPLVLSPQGRAVGKEAMGLAGDIANATVENSKSLANSAMDNGKSFANAAGTRAGQSAAAVQGMTQDATRQVGNMVGNGKAAAQDTSARVAERTSNIAQATSQRVGGAVETGKSYAQGTGAQIAEQTSNITQAASQRVGGVVETGKHTADDLSTKTKNTMGAQGENGSATGFDGHAMQSNGNTTGSLRLDAGHNQQHLNTGMVDRKAQHNQSAYQASDPSNVVPLKG